MISDTKQLYLFLFGVLFCLGIPAVVNYYLDPYQVFNARQDLNGRVLKQARTQNAGLINTHLTPQSGFTTMLIGTSHSQNFRPSFVEKTLEEGKVLKLAMSGSQPKTKAIVARAALRKNIIQHVVWEIAKDYRTLSSDTINQNHSFPGYLYNENKYDDLKYLFNLDTVKRSYTPNRQHVAYVDYGQWYREDIFETYHKAQNLKSLRRNLEKQKNDKGLLGLSLKKYDRNYPAIDKWLVPVIKENPDVHFSLFFPPYSGYYYWTRDHNEVYRILFLRRYILEQTEKFTNVDIYAFDNRPEISGTILNYKDETHYHISINEYIIQSIAKRKHRLKLENINDYEKGFINIINSFDILNYNPHSSSDK